MKLTPITSTPVKEKEVLLDMPRTPDNEDMKSTEQNKKNITSAPVICLEEDQSASEGTNSLLLPTSEFIEGQANAEISGQEDDALYAVAKNRSRREINTITHDPMIQTISGMISDENTDFPLSLTLLLTDPSHSPLRSDRSSRNSRPKLLRRRSRNNLVEAIVSKAVENLANRNRGHMKSIPQNISNIGDEDASDEGPSKHEKTNEKKDTTVGKSKQKIKPSTRGKNRKRLSDTGVLGQIGCNYITDEQSNDHQPPIKNLVKSSKKKPCASNFDDVKVAENSGSGACSIGTPSSSSSSPCDSITSNISSNQSDVDISRTNSSINTNDDSSYGDEDQLESYYSFDTKDDENDYSNILVPERMRDGSILFPDGKIIAPKSSIENSFLSSLDENESSQIDDEEYPHDMHNRTLSEASMSKDNSIATEQLKGVSENFEIDSFLIETDAVEIVEIPGVLVETSQDINESTSVVAAEVVSNKDDESSEYSTDTDHESDNVEFKAAPPPRYNSPTNSSTLSFTSTKRSNINATNINPPSNLLLNSEQIPIPRFQVSQPLSTYVKKNEFCDTTPRSSLSSSTTTTVTKISKHEFVKPQKWSLGSQIGAGSFGVVHVGMNDLTGNLMAVKILKNVMPNVKSKKNNSVIKELQREIDLMRSLSHPNIVRYFGAERREGTLYIFQEWVPGGSVSSLLRKFGSFTNSVVRRYLYQILQGLHYLHLNHILHRDIKGGNILVDDRGTIKLADFGASKQIFPCSSFDDSNNLMMQSLTIKGTPYFMAPEVFEQRYNKKADIWSVGGVILQMVSGQPPWKTLGFQSPMSLFYHLKSTHGPPPIEVDIESLSLKKIIDRCFERDVNLRPSAFELLKENFFQEDDENEESSTTNLSEESMDGREDESDFDESRNSKSLISLLAKDPCTRINTQTKKKAGFALQDDAYVSAMQNITNTDMHTRRQNKTEKVHNSKRHYTNKSNARNSLQRSTKFDETVVIEDGTPPFPSKRNSSKRTVDHFSKDEKKIQIEANNPISPIFPSNAWPSWAKKKVNNSVKEEKSASGSEGGIESQGTNSKRSENPFRRDRSKMKSSKINIDVATTSMSRLNIEK